MDVILLLRLLSFFLIFCGRWLNFRAVKKLIILIYVCCIRSLRLYSNTNETVSIFFYNYDFSLQLIYNSFTQRMGLLVLRLTFLIYLYIFIYLNNDPHVILFCGYFCFFSLSMLLIVFSNTILLFFIGWELVGFSSFLLISFWSTRRQAVKRGLKAFRLNKIGDLALLLRVVVIFINFHTFNLNELRILCALTSNNYLLEGISCLLIFCTLAKSAQIGFQAWLSDAMEGPTPVSALLHAATMVTAGLILLFRFSFLFILCPHMNRVLIGAGLRTILLSVILAVEQTDLKKIIAFSTCNQIGYMLYLAGLLHYESRFFHLRNHAFIKATLFLIAGRIIASSSHEQDIRYLSIYNFNFLKIIFLIGSFALLAGFFFTGFYSKELFFQVQESQIFINQTRFFLLLLSTVIWGSIIYFRNLLKIVKINNFIKVNNLEISSFNWLLSFLIIFCIRIGFLSKFWWSFEYKYWFIDALYFSSTTLKINEYTYPTLRGRYFIILYTIFYSTNWYVQYRKKNFFYFNDFLRNVFCQYWIKNLLITGLTYFFFYQIPIVSTSSLYTLSIYSQQFKDCSINYYRAFRGVLIIISTRFWLI
jgi:NADH:ubiquinone oxidoreductase subunit 5 (subunit L)/multisubunit Na+/H+ antiporter MnhA subunit